MRFTDDQLRTLDEALEKWGEHEQMMMAVGELGELLSLYGKMVQGRMHPDEMVDELADSFIMLRQIARIYGDEEVQARIDFKLARLKQKVAAVTP